MKTQLLEAARDLYLSEGLQGFSMRKLAAKCGVTAPAIYKHYRDKDQLLGAVIEHGFQLLEAELERAKRARTPERRLHKMGMAYMHFALNQPAYYRLIFMSTAQDFGLKQLAQDVHNQLSPSFLHLLECVRENCTQGLLPTDDALELAANFWSYFHGMVSLQLLGLYAPVLQTRPEFEAFYERAISRYLNGLN